MSGVWLMAMGVRVTMRMSRMVMPCVGIAVRMAVTFVAMYGVVVSLVSVLVSVVMSAALCYLNIEMGILLTNGHIDCSVACRLGCKLKMEHTVAMGCCSVALACQPEQQGCLGGIERLEIGQGCCIECNAGLFANLQPLMLQKEFGIVCICRETLYMGMCVLMVMSIGLTVVVATATTQGNSCYCRKKYLSHSNHLKT